MSSLNFELSFEGLTGHKPFPWQRALYDKWFMRDLIPHSASLPTGLGKTSIIAIWLIALANGARLPRRLVYVVNRRTVVDQTTEEVERYKLKTVAGIPDFAISTLRGQFADNREWSADPSRPAVICGTVDMIGSRLLFSGYGVGMKAKPLHAGFLGQDALLVHDEAHLEPAFQKLIETIRDEQAREPETPWPKFRVMELTATSRAKESTSQTSFSLTESDLQDPTVWQRMHAVKTLHLNALTDPKKPQTDLIKKALQFKDSGKAVLIYAYSVETVLDVFTALDKAKVPVKSLTGTMRGKERDDLMTDKTFARFLPDPPADATPNTVYLVCTSAGEVGVNISADHLICDLSTYESMAQRLGRVNRFGRFDPCEVHVYYPETWNEKHALTAPRQKTLELFKPFDGKSLSPKALSEIPTEQRAAAFAPLPTILPATDILFDAWTLTTITGKLPGRQPVEPYLHGITDWQPPETHIAWREEVGLITGDMLDDIPANELLEAYPLKPHELLKEQSSHAFKQFTEMAKRLKDQVVPAWIVDDDGHVEIVTVSDLADKEQTERFEYKTVLLPPTAGGLEKGMFNGAIAAPENESLDVADEWFIKDESGNLIRQRKRLFNNDPDDDPDVKSMHTVYSLAIPGADDDAEEHIWHWFVLRNEGDKSAKDPVAWDVHVGDVVTQATAIVESLPFDAKLKKAIVTAAKFHDHGKLRKQFQTVLGNFRWPDVRWAKSGKRGGRIAETYRHEFGSLVDLLNPDKEFFAELSQLEPEYQELVLHLIAAHHGRARPHFPADEAFDPDGHTELVARIARETPRRFALLQRKYGRWGLAYLESLLRAADWAASESPSKFVEGQP